MKKTRYRIISVLLSLCMAVSCIVVMNVAAGAETAVPANGSDAGSGDVYFVGYTMGSQGGDYVAPGDAYDGKPLFDGNGNNKACIGFNGSYSVEFSYQSAIIPHRYYFRTGDDTSWFDARNPSAWTLEGKNSNGEWTVLDSRTAQSYTTDNKTAAEFSISNTNSYETFRLTITAINEDGNDNSLVAGRPTFQLSEFYMSGSSVPVAKVGETEYADFAEALSSCSTSSPLILLDDVTADSTITVTGTRAIDLNGHNINSSVQTAISVSSGAELTISGSGKISNLILNQGTLNFNDAEVSAITTQGGLTNINSGKINAPSSWTALNSNNNGQVNISGGTIYADSWLCVYANNGTVNISGGVFQVGSSNGSNLLNTAGGGKIILSGGYFPEKISSAVYTLADGYTLVDSDDTSKGAKMVSVPTPVANVGSTEYTSFREALSNWTAGTTLTLLDDVTITLEKSQSKGATWVAGISVQGCQKTLDLNGHTMALSPDISVSQERVIEVVQSGSLTINDSSGTNAGKITGASPSGDNGWSGALYINSGATVNMYGGTITGNVTTNGAGVWIDGRGHKGNAAFNMYDGVISGNTATNGGGVYVGCQLNEYAGTAQFNMYGGTITGNTATNGGNVYVDKGVLTHTGGTINGGLTDKSSRYVKVTFDANGASGTMSEQYVQKSTNTTAKENEFTNGDIEFRGWNTAADGSGTAYADKADLNVTADTTLYAQWLISLDDSFIEPIEEQTYTGSAIEPALTVKNGETALTADTDYTAEYSDNINAGTATVTITGSGIYTGTAQATFTINKANPEYTAPTGLTAMYGDTLADVTLPEGWAWEDSAQSVGNAGTNNFNAVFTPDDTANYEVLTGIELTVTVDPEINSDVSSPVSVEVKGLEEEARTVRQQEGGNVVNVTLEVEKSSEDSSSGAAAITDLAPDKKLVFYEISVEKNIDSVTSLMSTTANVLEIAVPCEFTAKRDLKVFRYHDGSASELTESDSKSDGTFRVDKSSGLVYIYANKFSTYAIGYTPYYSISGSAALAGYTGNVQAELTNSDGSTVAKIGSISLNNLTFKNLPKGEYSLTIKWTEIVENSLTIPLTLK